MEEWIDEQFDSIELVENDVFGNFEKIESTYKSCVESIFNSSFNDDDRKRRLIYTFQKLKKMVANNGGFEQYFEYCEAVEMKRAFATLCNNNGCISKSK